MAKRPRGELPTAVYGAPFPDLVEVPPDAIQVSPTHPGAASLADFGAGELGGLVMAAPPGTIERRYALALALRALSAGAVLTALARKDKGGSRLRKELEGLGCTVVETARSHHRICICERPEDLNGLAQALEEGALRWVQAIALWSQPGVFSWDRTDPGSALLAQHLPAMGGRGADLGCGVGYLARAVLTSPKIVRLDLIDVDRRAIAAARLNIDDPRVVLHWADANAPDAASSVAQLRELDFVVMNPPFHDAGAEDRGLGQAFIRRAAQLLRKGGACWLVANRHLPYEAVLGEAFTKVETRAEAGGYKVFEARR